MSKRKLLVHMYPDDIHWLSVTDKQLWLNYKSERPPTLLLTSKTPSAAKAAYKRYQTTLIGIEKWQSYKQFSTA